jgi:hypothetical protein
MITGCDDRGGRKFGGSAWDHNLSISELALERAIITDIMGGIAAGAIQPEEMSLTESEIAEETTETPAEETTETPAEDTEASVNVNKISISVPWNRAMTGDADSVVNSFEYAGPEGGTLVIDVYGNIDQVSPHMGDTSTLLFSPLNVIFTFNTYTYPNSCGLIAQIDGVLNCRLQGSADSDTDVVELTGSCTTGSEGSAGSLAYKLSEEEIHDVFIQSNIKAMGPWSELTAYRFFGTYMLDRRGGTIDSVIGSAPGLCTEE